MDPVNTAAVPMDLLLAHRGWVRSLALRLARDEQSADDLEQQTWLRALQNPPLRAESARAWLATVLRHLARDGWRSETRRTRRETAVAAPDSTPGSAELVARAEAHRRLIREVLRLREPYRTVVLLRFFEDLPPREIAQRTATPPATVRSRLHRALDVLRTRLDAEDLGWRLALLPLPGAVLTNSAMLAESATSTTALLGGIAMTAKKKIAAVAALLALLCASAYVVVADDDVAPEATAAPETAAAAPTAERQRVEVPRTEDPAPEPEPPTPLPPPVEQTAPPVPTVEHLAVTVLRSVPPREVPRGYREIASSDEIPEIGGGEPDGDMRRGGGGMSPLPYWQRWPSPPETGTVTLRGRITDATGRPLAEAQVMRVSLDGSGTRSSPASYQWIKEIAVTGPGGRFEAHHQPEGSWLIAAEWFGTRNTSRGLDLGGAIDVTAGRDDVLTGLDVQLPIESARMAFVTGTVRNHKGQPVKNAAVWIGRTRREYTAKDGTFRFGALEPGSLTLLVDKGSFEPAEIELELAPGARRDVPVGLELAETGPLVLEGRVIDEEGRPVVDVPIFLGASRQGSRWARTDDTGTFRFENLHQKYAKQTVDVMVSPNPDSAPVLPTVRKGLTVPAPGLELVTQRVAPLTIHLRDAISGAPVVTYVVHVEAETVTDGEASTRRVGGAWKWDETGTFTVRVPKGRLIVTARAKGYTGIEVDVALDDAGGLPKAITVEMQPE